MRRKYLNLYLTSAILAALFVLLLLSGFFSAAETAFTGFSQIKMKNLAKSRKSARIVLEMNKNFGEVLTVLLIGNNLVNILATSLTTILFTAYFEDGGITLSTIVMTLLVLVFGEVTPKTIAKERPEEFAMLSCRVVKVCHVLFFPLCRLFGLWKKILCKMLGFNKRRPTMTGEEFSIIVSDIANEGVLHRSEEELIKNALRYADMTVASVMVAAKNITHIEKTDSMDDILKVFEESNYSRVPVTDGGLQSVIGILYRVDFYEMRLSGRSDILPVLKPVFKCKPSDKLPQLLKFMQATRRHLAIVADGSRVLGLITVEDIVEQLVGEIQDRYDSVPERQWHIHNDGDI